jgi:hypothetical protein
VRSHFVRRLLPGVPLGRLALRALAPVAAAAAAVGAVRLALWGGDRAAAQAAAELALFVVVYAAATWLGERNLIAELRDTARRR